MRKTNASIIAIIILLAVTVAATAEPMRDASAALHGTITDARTNEPIPGASVLLIGTERGAAADIDGNYRVVNVPPNRYAIRFSAVGYSPVVKSDIVLTSARDLRLDVALEPTTVELEELTFTPGYFASAEAGEISTTVQSNEEIRRLPGGFEDVVRAISILPGVSQVSPGRNDLIVRGGAPSENLFLVEDFEIPNINHFGSQGSTGGPQSFINLDFVEQTRFSTGGFGVRYGDKLSSVLRVDLRSGRDDRFGGKATVSATQFGLNVEGPYADGRGTYLFSARRSYLDFIFRAAGFSFVPEYYDFLAKTDYQLDDRNTLTVLGIGALDNVKLFNDDPDQRYDNARVPASDQVISLGGLSWQRSFTGGFTTVSLWHSLQDFQVVQRDSLLQPIFRNESREQELGSRAEIVYSFDENTRATAGLQHTVAGFDVDVTAPPYEGSFGETISLDRNISESSFKSAAYTELERKIGFLKLTGGLRLDYFDLLEDGFALSPRASAAYPWLPRSNLTFAVGRYYQAPSYVWLSRPENRSLNYIGADQVVAGIDYLLRSDVRVSLEGFYKDYFDYPVSVQRPYLVLANTGVGYSGTSDNFAAYGFDQLVSAGNGWSRGFELFAQKRAGENPHYAIVSLTWSETRFTGLDGIERPSSFDQRWLFNVGGGWIFNRNWELSFKFRLATGTPYTPYELGDGDLPAGSQDPARYNSERTDINHSLDLRVDRRWFFDRWALVVYADVQNVYDNPYSSPPRWDEREGEASDESGIGLLPTIGISAEF